MVSRIRARKRRTTIRYNSLEELLIDVLAGFMALILVAVFSVIGVIIAVLFRLLEDFFKLIVALDWFIWVTLFGGYRL